MKFNYLSFINLIKNNNLYKKKFIIINNNFILLNHLVKLIITKFTLYKIKINVNLNKKKDWKKIYYIINNSNLYYKKYFLIINLHEKLEFKKNIYYLEKYLRKINNDIIIIYKILINKNKILIKNIINNKNYFLIIDNNNKKNLIHYIKYNINLLKLNIKDKQILLNYLIQKKELIELHQLFNFLKLIKIKKIKIQYLIQYLQNFNIYELLIYISKYDYFNSLRIIKSLQVINSNPCHIIYYLNNFIIKIINYKFNNCLFNKNINFFISNEFINYCNNINIKKILIFINLIHKLQLLIYNTKLFWIKLQELMFFLLKI